MTSRVIGAFATLFATLFAVAPLGAQGTAPLGGIAGCEALLVARSVSSPPGIAGVACKMLADLIVERFATPALLAAMAPREELAVSARDLQSRASGDATGAGSAAQGEAVPAVNPLALAGGSLAAVGSGGGSDAVAAFSLNPAIFFPGSGDLNRDAARSRLMDLTILTPVNRSDADSADTPDYFGLRLRINVASLSSRARLVQARDAFAAQVDANETIALRLEERLLAAPNVGLCAAAYERSPVDSVSARSACGGYVRFTPDDAHLATMREGLLALRDSIDASYFGLDLRYDRGDATLGAVPGFSGTMLFAGVAFGKQLNSGAAGGPTMGLRGRLGVQHFTVDSGAVADTVTVGTTIDGAIAFEFTRPYEFRPLRIIGGLEFRQGAALSDALSAAVRPRSVQFRISVDVPISPANGVSISYASPVSGAGKPTLSVNLNWQMLMAEMAPKP